MPVGSALGTLASIATPTLTRTALPSFGASRPISTPPSTSHHGPASPASELPAPESPASAPSSAPRRSLGLIPSLNHQRQHLAPKDQAQGRNPAQAKGKDRFEGSWIEQLNCSTTHGHGLSCRHRARISVYPLHLYIEIRALSSFGMILISSVFLKKSFFVLHHIARVRS